MRIHTVVESILGVAFGEILNGNVLKFHEGLQPFIRMEMSHHRTPQAVSIIGGNNGGPNHDALDSM